MRYRIEEIKLNPDEALIVNNNLRIEKDGNRIAVFCDEEILKEKIAKKLRIKTGIISNTEIVRRSIDARGDETKFVYTLDFDCDKKLSDKVVQKKDAKAKGTIVASGYGAVSGGVAGDASDCARPVVVGFGPCGMFCALVLARAGLKPIVIERGSAMDDRVAKVKEFWENKILDPECNVQFGEGGAGTFSDGKLNTGIKEERIRFVLETFVNAGASSDILIDARPHIGTDVLRDVVKNIRKEIIALGGEIHFDTKLEEIELCDGAGDASAKPQSISRIKIRKKSAVEASDSGQSEEYIETDNLVLALGHSARDTVRYLYDVGLRMEAKSFSMGVRVQHPQELIDRATYGDYYGHPALTPAYYKLSYRAEDGRGVYSFCMCPGGEIVNAASQEGGVVTNGMSNAARNSDFANSGILVDVKPSDYSSESNPLAGIAFQEKYERLAFINGGSDYTLPQNTWGAYRDAVAQRDVERVANSLPDFVARDICEAMPHFGKKIKGFDADDTLMVAIESRSSSPVRLLRDKETLCANMRIDESHLTDTPIRGLYPGGEGAGYAGGITSAACDGIRVAEKIIEKRLGKDAQE